MKHTLLKYFVCIACWYTRNCDKLRGRYRLIKFLEIKHHLFDNLKKVRVKLKHAGFIELLPSDYIDKKLFIHGEYESNLIELLYKLLHKGDGFLDIGANIGYFSLIASNIVKKEGTVYAFEASLSTFNRLKINSSLNKERNIHVYNYAVSDKEDVLILNIQKSGNSGMSSLRKLEGYESESISVDAKPIDSFLQEINQIKLIKMDIEGAEGLAIQGMTELIKRDRPYITLELVDKYLLQLGYSAESIIEKLKQLNYKIYILDFPLQKLDYIPKDQCNILCIPEELSSEDL